MPPADPPDKTMSSLRETPEDGWSILASLPVALLLVKENGEVLYANEKACALLGERCPKPCSKLGCSLRIDELLAPLDVLWSKANSDIKARPSLEVQSDQGKREFGYTMERISSSGRVHWAIALSDITQWKRAEEERDQLIRLGAVAEILPMILHELKNPLSAAAARLELLLEESEARMAAELHPILVEIRRAMLFIDGYGSVGRGLRSKRPNPVDQALSQVAALLLGVAGRRGVRLSVEISPLPHLPFELSSLRSIVWNLLTNAIQACEAGQGKEVRLRASFDGSALEIEVIDEGKGITPEVLARCRELFFTTKPKGTGIGLALCSRLVEEAGGRLDIESEVGKGTRVRVHLPLAGEGHFSPPASH